MRAFESKAWLQLKVRGVRDSDFSRRITMAQVNLAFSMFRILIVPDEMAEDLVQ